VEEMILPGLYAILSPITVGFLIGPICLVGLLAGSIASGMMLAIMMANAGGAWDNAKKYIEIEGEAGGKGTETHKACVVGDTVGDPFKDTSGPSLNILIKLMSIISLTVAPLMEGFETWESAKVRACAVDSPSLTVSIFFDLSPVNALIFCSFLRRSGV
jgi:Na+/H+-translocating membrane pyrophosphatase